VATPPVIAASSGSGFFFIIIIAFLLLWLVVVRPQRRRQSQQQQMLSELHVGDEVLTAGGIYGTITRLDDDTVTVEIAPKLEVRVARRAIAGVTHDEPEAEGAEASDEPQEENGGERWRSAFDEDDAGAEASGDEKHG
jgi:preprotein translocase subunit YajC